MHLELTTLYLQKNTLVHILPSRLIFSNFFLRQDDFLPASVHFQKDSLFTSS